MVLYLYVCVFVYVSLRKCVRMHMCVSLGVIYAFVACIQLLLREIPSH